MKYLASSTSLSFILLLNVCKTPSTTVEVLDCYDGDTCTIRWGNALTVRARLGGIDAPEIGRIPQPFAKESRDYLRQEVKGQSKIVQYELDKYNRPVVEIFKENESINLKMIERGYAEAYRGPSQGIARYKFFRKERLARGKKRGIWSLSAYESPRKFRARRR